MTPRFARLAVPSLIGSVLLIGACAAASSTTTVPVPSALSSSTGQASLAAATPSPTPPPTLSPTVAPVLVSPDPNAPASGIVDKIAITDARFSVASLAAPANKTWTLQVDFKDPLGAHNVTVEIRSERRGARLPVGEVRSRQARLRPARAPRRRLRVRLHVAS